MRILVIYKCLPYSNDDGNLSLQNYLHVLSFLKSINKYDIFFLKMILQLEICILNQSGLLYWKRKM